MQAISAHVESLRQWTYSQLLQLRHSNGQPLVRLFGRHAEGPRQQGGIFQFQVRHWTYQIWRCNMMFLHSCTWTRRFLLAFCHSHAGVCSMLTLA